MRQDRLATAKVPEPPGDPEIRDALRSYLQERLAPLGEAAFMEEVGLRHGMVRVDLLVLNGSLHGYEVKSDRDSLRRLPRQASVYSQVLDQVTLVVGQRHSQKVSSVVPDWWGITVVRPADGESMEFEPMREANQNPAPDKLSIAKLLWREEALAILEEIGAGRGVKSKPRALVHGRLAETLDLDLLRARVRHQLKSRTDWRSGGQQMSCGG